MSITIADNHLATITNTSESKKTILYSGSNSSYKIDKFLVKVLENAIILNIDKEFYLNYSTFAVTEHTLKLSGDKLLVVNTETNSVYYDNNFLTETSPNIYNFQHNGNDYVLETSNGHFTLSKVGSLEVFSSETSVIS